VEFSNFYSTVDVESDGKISALQAITFDGKLMVVLPLRFKCESIMKFVAAFLLENASRKVYSFYTKSHTLIIMNKRKTRWKIKIYRIRLHSLFYEINVLISKMI